MTNTECGCSRPLRDTWKLCDVCRRELRKQLGEIGWLDDQLEISLTRAKGVAYDGGSRASTTGLPWNEKAAQARDGLKATMVRWIYRINGQKIDRTTPMPQLANWLINHIDTIAKRDDAWTINEELQNAANRARNTVTAKAPTREYLGLCDLPADQETLEGEPCGGDVYWTEGEETAICEKCRGEFEPEPKIIQRDAALADVLCTAYEIARLTHKALGQPWRKVYNQVTSWNNRGAITPHATDQEGAPRFRYLDVQAKLIAAYAHDAERSA